MSLPYSHGVGRLPRALLLKPSYRVAICCAGPNFLYHSFLVSLSWAAILCLPGLGRPFFGYLWYDLWNVTVSPTAKPGPHSLHDETFPRLYLKCCNIRYEWQVSKCALIIPNSPGIQVVPSHGLWKSSNEDSRW